MPKRIPQEERETHICWDMEEKIAHITTNVKKDILRCNKLTESDPNNWKLISEDGVTYRFTAPLNCILMKAAPKKRHLTEEQRAAYSARAKQNLHR